MRKMILKGLIGLVLLGGCASSASNINDGGTSGSLAETDSGAASRMMDQQETALRDALADWESAVVKREGDLLTVTLKTDPGFGTGSAAVDPAFYGELDQIAQILVRYPQTDITVEGHTDDTGSQTYNLLLSERRARHIKHHFVQQGVPTQRVRVVGLGESRPAASNSTALGRQMNRRVEILIQPRK